MQITDRNSEKNIYMNYFTFKNKVDITPEKTTHEANEVERLFFKFINSYNNNNSKILDIGCGNGNVLSFLRKKGFQHVTGVDISEEAVRICNLLGFDNVFHADIKDFFLHDNKKYDIIFALDFIEHHDLDAIMNILQIVNSILNSGGLLIAQTPNGASLFGRIYFSDDISHKTLLTEKSIFQLLSICGFKNISLYSLYPNIKSGIKGLVRYILFKLIEMVMKVVYMIQIGENRIVSPNIIIVAHK